MLLSIPSSSIKAIFATWLLLGSPSWGVAQEQQGNQPYPSNTGGVREERGLVEKATKTPKAPGTETKAPTVTKAPKTPKGATSAPSMSPSSLPSLSPSLSPSVSPTESPSSMPSLSPSLSPSASSLPSLSPSEASCYDDSEVTELLEILAEVSDMCLMLTPGTPQNLGYEYVRDYPADLTVASSTNAEWHQRFVLSVFYYSITNDPDDRLSKWVPASPPTYADIHECKWGIAQCSDGVHVSHMDLEYTSLEGTFPSEFGALSTMAVMYLVNNPLLAPNNLEALGNLQGLQMLAMNLNGLTSIPTEIGNIDTLFSLSINDNALKSVPTELGNLGNLASLLVGNNDALPLPLPSEICDLLTEGNLANLQCDAGSNEDCCLQPF